MLRSKHTIFGAMLLAALVATLAAGCTGSANAGVPSAAPAQQARKVTVDGGSYNEVDAAGLAAMLKSKDFVLVDVHVPYAGEIESTDLFLPYDQIQANVSKLPADKGAKIVLYCVSGSMSTVASRTLVGLGYTNVWNLSGGMMGWKQAGYSLLSKSQ